MEKTMAKRMGYIRLRDPEEILAWLGEVEEQPQQQEDAQLLPWAPSSPPDTSDTMCKAMTLANPLSLPSVLQDSSFEAPHLANLHPHTSEQVEMCKGECHALIMYKGNLLAPDALPIQTEVLRRTPQLKEAENSSKEEVCDDCYSLLFESLPPDLELHLEDPYEGEQEHA